MCVFLAFIAVPQHTREVAMVKAQAEIATGPRLLTLSYNKAAGVRAAPGAQAAQQGVDALGKL